MVELRSQEPFTGGADLFHGQAGCLDDVVPLHLFQLRKVGLEADGMARDEIVVEHRGQAGRFLRTLCVQQVFPEALEECLVAAGPDLQEVISQLRTHPVCRDGLRVLEVKESGLGERIDGYDPAPFFLAFSSALSMRGWFVPGFCPATKMRPAVSRSFRLTEPLPMPMVSTRADPEDSWHMFEQSGRLLVPTPRTSSWYTNAASFEVRPDV